MKGFGVSPVVLYGLSFFVLNTVIPLDLVHRLGLGSIHHAVVWKNVQLERTQVQDSALRRHTL